MDRGREFARRVQTYQRLDAVHQSRTRFFAAAALTNAVLTRLFQLAPARSLSDAYGLLRDAGAVLEVANLAWARELCETPEPAWSAGTLDELLVRREQRLLQHFIESATLNRRVRAGVQSELNRLLNGRHWTLLGAPWLEPGRRIVRVLGDVRLRLGHPFDFDQEAHRVQLGLGMIREARHSVGLPKGCAAPDRFRLQLPS